MVVSSFPLYVLFSAIGASFTADTLNVTVAVDVSPSASVIV
jgi:hypothetical protein